jgi:DHA1 family bicyclomycin/chloramphenicol resistance-like MFS transporter
MLDLSRRFVASIITLTVAVIAIIAAVIELDLFLPGLPEIQKYFTTPEMMVQMLLGENFLGPCASVLFYRGWSDSSGRLRLLLAGLGIFAIASIGRVFSESIHTLIFWLFV